jgi:hypothetical protein
MNWQGTRSSLKHLGTLYGRGDLLIANGAQNLGSVTYEIDGYSRRTMRSDSGQIEGSADMLARAFRHGSARLVLADGQCVDVTLSDPRGTATAEVKVSGRFPQFDHAC